MRWSHGDAVNTGLRQTLAILWHRIFIERENRLKSEVERVLTLTADGNKIQQTRLEEPDSSLSEESGVLSNYVNHQLLREPKLCRLRTQPIAHPDGRPSVMIRVRRF